jgi:hypothetical protein
MKFLSNVLTVKFDAATGNLLISHPDTKMFPSPLVTIRPETWEAMEFDDVANFLGNRLLLLMPEMREHFKAHLERLAASEDGNLD